MNGLFLPMIAVVKWQYNELAQRFPQGTADVQELPRLLITLGDVAGIGPEVLLKLWVQPEMFAQSQPIVVGNATWLRKIAKKLGLDLLIQELDELPDTWPTGHPGLLPCLQGSNEDLNDVVPGKAQRSAGRAAYDFLKTAIALAKGDKADAIVTLPLHKEGLHLAGLDYPGHTEILAKECGIEKYAMMLYAPLKQKDDSQRGGVGVAHVTLHQSLRSIFDDITVQAIVDKIELTHDIMSQLLGNLPRIGVCALNPHAGDGGLFGDEEARIIAPAVEQCRKRINVSGPWPCDTLFRRAQAGEFDGIVAMYHDQGHIALKLMSGFHLVNITLGLPIIRTSVAHGTAYDIVNNHTADPFSLLAAVEVACKLVIDRRRKALRR